MKLLLTFLFYVLALSASNDSNHIKTQILEKILSKVNINKEIRIYSDSPKIMSELKKNSNFITVLSYEDATLLILENNLNTQTEYHDKTIFVLNYKLLTDIPQSFGALFWKKGRPNIVFIEPRVEAQSIKLAEDLQKYLEEKIW